MYSVSSQVLKFSTASVTPSFVHLFSSILYPFSTIVSAKIWLSIAVWDVTPLNLVNVYRRFGGTLLHYVAEDNILFTVTSLRIPNLTLVMYFGTPVTVCPDYTVSQICRISCRISAAL
jgi:hypothetical protein